MEKYEYSFLICAMGHRIDPYIINLIKSVYREFKKHHHPNLLINFFIHDSSQTKEDSENLIFKLNNLDFISLEKKKRFNIILLDEDKIFYTLRNKEPRISYFIDDVNQFLEDSNLNLRSKTKIKNAHQPVAIERMRVIILYLDWLEKRLEQEPHLIQDILTNKTYIKVWILDDDHEFKALNSINYLLRMDVPHRNYFSVCQECSKYAFGISGFTGDWPSPMFTFGTTLGIMIGLLELINDYKNQKFSLNVEESTNQLKNISIDTIQEILQKNIQKIFPSITNRVPLRQEWLDLNISTLEIKIYKDLLKLLDGDKVNYHIGTDTHPFPSQNYTQTNFLLNPEILLLNPYFPPPIGNIRGSDCNWGDTIKEILKVEEIPYEIDKHPNVFHNAAISKRSMGKQIYWRENHFDKGYNKINMCGLQVKLDMWDPYLGEINRYFNNRKISKNRNKDKNIDFSILEEKIKIWKQEMMRDYIKESQKGLMLLDTSIDKLAVAHRYIIIWRKCCLKLFKNVAELFFKKYNKKLDKFSVKAMINY